MPFNKNSFLGFQPCHCTKIFLLNNLATKTNIASLIKEFIDRDGLTCTNSIFFLERILINLITSKNNKKNFKKFDLTKPDVVENEEILWLLFTKTPLLYSATPP